MRGLQPGQDISQVAYNLQPADMSSQIIMAIDKAVGYTKDCLGATDAQLGNVKPENTSALMVLQNSAEIPLENIRAGLYEWLEDIGAILLDMMGTYYGVRSVMRGRVCNEPVMGAQGTPLIDPETGLMRMTMVMRRVAEPYDFSRFKNLWFNVRVNAGATTYYSEIAMIQTLDNPRREGILDMVEYLERIPDKLIPRKAELVESLKKRVAEGDTLPAQEKNARQENDAQTLIGGKIGSDQAIAKLPVSMQVRYDTMPASAKSALRQIGAMGR